MATRRKPFRLTASLRRRWRAQLVAWQRLVDRWLGRP
jgi:hypothetical protein